MGFLKAIGGFLSGGTGKAIIDMVKGKFPPNMSEAEQAALEQEIIAAANERDYKLLELAGQQDEAFNRRIADLEGTASDLKSIPILGPIIIFLRGLQRPAWGFATLLGDYWWFMGKFDPLTEQMESALWVINLLVLGFLFGERAVKNLAPIIEKVFAK